jgi:L-seryl-tRNA(Ser) seleniumtransferase
VTEESLRSLPSVDQLLRRLRQRGPAPTATHSALVDVIRRVINEERAHRAAARSARTEDQLIGEVIDQVGMLLAEAQPVINATGVILHTNLGRAPLSAESRRAMETASRYGDLEFDLATGSRGSRQRAVSRLLRALTGAEACLVVGSNAAGILLALTALCRGKDVLVARGQAVEIGGGFRIPEILRQSGARLMEVGTTNRTRVEDYAAAVTTRTAAILHVHASNFRIIGFTEAPDLRDLSVLTHERGIWLLVDNGSGSLLDTSTFGLAHEPTPCDALAAGADLVAFSGDKLLGGPQAGVILGSSGLVERLQRHPLARAVRPDKLILAALSATLRAYVRGDALDTIPVWQMIAQNGEELDRRAKRFQKEAAARGLRLDRIPGQSTVGGGSLPGETLPTTLLVLPEGVSAAGLRSGPVAVVGRTQADRVILDLRTVAEDEEDALLAAVLNLCSGGP